MCSEKIVRTEKDLRILVTGVILRQNETFDELQIFSCVKSKLTGSKYCRNPDLVMSMIENTLLILSCYNVLGNLNGKYFWRRLW